MLVECNNCGAPLDVKPGAVFEQCKYCNKLSRVQKLQTIQAQTPQNWRPPPVWTPPPQLPAISRPMQYHRSTNKVLVWFIVLSAVIPILLTVVGVVISVIAGAATSTTSYEVSSPVEGPTITVNQPSPTKKGGMVTGGRSIMCSGNQKKTISNRMVNPASGPAVMASGNCQLTLVNCTLGGNPVIVTSANAQVTVRGGSVTASGMMAIVASGKSVVTVSGAKVTGSVIQTGNATINQ